MNKKMKKSNYIGKYDYIAYYTKQPAFWFFSNTEVMAAIEAQLKLVCDENDIDEEDEESADFEEENEIDYYELYKQAKEENATIDDDNPQIFEGNMIDKESRNFVKELYPNIKTIIDLEDDPKIKFASQEELAKLTQQLIEQNENIIIFQPVFISGHMITKPDALVKQDIEIRIIETKGTTTAKRHHFLDILFQSKVMHSIDYLQDYYFIFSLCLVKFCYANKHEVPLTITDSFNISKAVSLKSGLSIAQKRLKKEARGFFVKDRETDEEEFIEAPITLSKVCDGDLSDLENYIDLNPYAGSKKTAEEFKLKAINLFREFDEVVEKLYNIRQEMQNNGKGEVVGKIKPSSNEKSYWKTSDLFIILRNLYKADGYKLFNYSGNVAYQTEEYIRQYKKTDNVMKYIKITKDFDYHDFFDEKAPAITVNRVGLREMWDELQPKKVYFDFETINSPIRPIDNCLPFMQILTQCSVIIDDNDGTPVKDLKCNNIVIDPLNITLQDFKHVVDSLYRGPEYSYIVYNASFERSRLKELKTYLKDEPDHEEYCNKIDCINAHMYDIANFFVVNSNKYNRPIVIKELGGFYSIKKVLPYIMNHHREIFDDTGCVDYHSLDTVQNGKICQGETTKRFHNLLSNDKWNALVINLKKYCENDVRAMIAVEYFVKELVNQYLN